jgi:hypothetical protein
MALSIDWQKLADNYMHDVRAYAIEVGATSTVLLGSLIAGKVAARAAISTGKDFLLVGEGTFNAAAEAVAAKTARFAGRGFVGRILTGAARSTITAGRVAFTASKGVSATTLGWLLGGIMAIDTASEAADLIWRIKSLGVMTLRHIPYDEGDIELLVRLLRSKPQNTDEKRELILTREQCAVLVLLASHYSDAKLTADTKSALIELYQKTLESDDGSNLFTVPVVGSDPQVTRVMRFAEELSRYYGSFSRDDHVIINIMAILLGKLKIKPGFKIASKIIAIGE